MSSWQETFPWTAAVLRFLWPEGPARRKRWIRFALVVVVLVATHVALTLWMAARTASVVSEFVARFGPMDAAAHRPAGVEDAANKARAVRAAAEVMVHPPAGIGGPKAHESFGTWTEQGLSPADRALVRKVVEDNALALSLLDLAAARAGASWDLHYERGVEMDIPPLLRILQLAKLNAAAGRLALDDGRLDDAVTAVRRGGAIAASLEQEPVLIVQFVRLAIERINRTLSRGILAAAALGPEQLAVLRSARPGVEPRRALRLAWVVEVKAFDTVFRTGSFDSVARPGAAETDGALGIGVVRAIARPFLLNEERIWLETRTRHLDGFDSPLHARRDPGAGPKLRPWNVLVRIIGVEDVSHSLERVDLAEAGTLVADVAIAVERHRVATGKTPATLAELVPAYLPAVPVDPLTGGAFAYATDGTAWRVRSEFEWSTWDTGRLNDPVLDWSKPPHAFSAASTLPRVSGRR